MIDVIIKGNQNTTKLINQLKNSSEQYPVLSKDAEREMIDKYKSDRDKLNFLLFMHNIRTVFNLAKTYKSRTDDYDSVVQNGMLGLAEAVRRFDPERNIKFCTFANNWVHKYLSMPYYTSQFKVDSKTISINTPAPSTDGDCTSADDTLENCINSIVDPTVWKDKFSVENQVSSDEQSAICNNLYNYINSDSSLSATDKAVFKEIFIDHEKTRNIAEKYDLDVSDVSEIKYRILDKCRVHLRDAYSITKYSDIAV